MLIGLMLLLMSLASSAAMAANVSEDTDKPRCAEIILINPFVGWGVFNDPVVEVFASRDGAPFSSTGKLFRGDWGSFRFCGKSLNLRFRFLSNPRNVKGPKLQDKGEYSIRIGNENRVYFQLLGKWGEVDVSSALELIDAINKRSGPPSPSGEDFGSDSLDRRKLYYGPECYQKSERCP
ncbi:MAG: hypothetical protein ACO1PN_00430 [Betaproteobacteria bacterium]